MKKDYKEQKGNENKKENLKAKEKERG